MASTNRIAVSSADLSGQIVEIAGGVAFGNSVDSTIA